MYRFVQILNLIFAVGIILVGFPIQAASIFSLGKPKLLGCNLLFVNPTVEIARRIENTNKDNGGRLFHESFDGFSEKFAGGELPATEALNELTNELASASFNGRWLSPYIHKGLLEKRLRLVLDKLDETYRPAAYANMTIPEQYWNTRARHSVLVKGVIPLIVESLGYDFVQHYSILQTDKAVMTMWHNLLKPIARMIILSNPRQYRTLSVDQISQIFLYGVHSFSAKTQAYFFRMIEFAGNKMSIISKAAMTTIILGLAFTAGMSYRAAVDIEADKVYSTIEQAMELKSLQSSLLARQGNAVYHRAIELYRERNNGKEPPQEWIQTNQEKLRGMYPGIKFE